MKGKEFENIVVNRMKWEEKHGRATMARYGVHAVRIKGEWQPINSLPDFEGVLRNGRQFVFDAKVCRQSSFPLQDDKLHVRQREHLLRRADFNAICFLLIHFPERVLRTRIVPMETWAFPVYRNHPFWESFERAEVRSITRQHCWDWGVSVTWDLTPKARITRPNVVRAIRELAKKWAEDRKKESA